MSPDPEPSQSKVSGSVWVVLAIAVLTFVFYPRNTNKGSNPTQPNLQQSNIKDKNSTITSGSLIATNPAILGSHDRLALLESFSSLDSTVVDRCLANTVLSSRQFLMEENVKLAREFISEVKACQSLEMLKALFQALEQLSKVPAGTAQGEPYEKMRGLPGSGLVLAERHNRELLKAFGKILSQRILQLRSNRAIDELKNIFLNHLQRQFVEQGVEISLPGNLLAINEADIQWILRHWELSSTRFLLGISGNAAINKHIQDVHSGEIQPIYTQALNAVLDPAKRRFRTVASYRIQSNPGSSSAAVFQNDLNGQVALVEFDGAISRAKLFSDWQQGIGAGRANGILYSPGFNPHAQVLLGQEGLPEPEYPAATIDLPPVTIELIKPVRIVLKVPSLEHNAVLFLNDPLGNNWTASIDGKAVDILRANNTARAVYLKPKKSVRTVEFVKRSSSR